MIPTLYPTGRFAAKAGVTVRTLRFYDRAGLLRPSAVTEAGHRRYSDRDLARLQQIQALKLLGFSLEEIRETMQAGRLPLQETLAIQMRMMEERRARIDRALQAMGHLKAAAAAGWELDWELLAQAIRVTQMEQNYDRVMSYYSEEARKKLEERMKSYSQEQAWADARRWQEVIDGMKAAAAQGADPASPEVQELAKRFSELVGEFTMGDPAIEQGLAKMYQDESGPFPKPYGKDVEEFVNRALAIYRRQ